MGGEEVQAGSPATWKVFVPYQLLSAPAGSLYGSIESAHSLMCVASLECYEEAVAIGELASGPSPTWTGRTRNPTVELGSLWLQLHISSGTLKCKLLKLSEVGTVAEKCICVLYDPNDLLSSYVVVDEASEGPTPQDRLAVVVQCLQKARKQRAGAEWTRSEESSLMSHAASLLCSLMGIFFWVFRYVGSLVETRVCCHGVLKIVLAMPEVSGQLTTRYRSSVQALRLDTSKARNSLRRYNACMRQLLDSGIGLLLLAWMVHSGAAYWMAASIMDWADGVARQLEELLHWLKGAPAGLKLNTQLAHFLSHFFLYQLHLWTAYLSILRPCLGPILHYAMAVGVLGVSFQMACIQDLVSMLTIHMYCFYVYAARAYSLQVGALASLWRLFRGKKWNVLRGRVDSVTYDIDQLFVGTLLFTTLLFLLPTVALHYFVFVALRLLLLCVQGAMSWCVSLLNSLPFASMALWCLRSKAVAGNAVFTVLSQHTNSSCVVLYLQVTQLPLFRLTRESGTAVTDFPKRSSLGLVLGQIFSGRLIYPWHSLTVGQDAEKSSCGISYT